MLETNWTELIREDEETGAGRIYIRAWVMLDGGMYQCELTHADAGTQRAAVIVRGTVTERVISFDKIQNVALVYTDGTIIQNFGAPKVTREESIFFVRGCQNA